MKWFNNYYIDMWGDAVPVDGWFLTLERPKYNHAYKACIYERADNGYYAFIHLYIGNKPIRKIMNDKAEGKYFKTLNDAKKLCESFIRQFDSSKIGDRMIEDWKYDNCKPVFDLNLNYVGDTYFGPSYIYNPNTLKWDRTEYDYFNDNPVNYEKGKYHILELCKPEDDFELRIHNVNISPVCIGGEWIHDLILENTLLEKVIQLDNSYLKRFKDFALSKSS